MVTSVPVLDQARPYLYGNCDSCPLFEPDWPKLVRGYGVADRLVVVGEAPGASEVSQGRPFVGDSGRLIRRVLTELGVDIDEDVYWTNAVLCRPPGNKTPTPTAIKACNDRLMFELNMVQPAKMLALGGVALSGVMGTPAGLPITKWHGKGMMVSYGSGEVYTVPTYHPAAVMRDLDLFRDFAYDIEKLLTHDAPLPPPEIEAMISGVEPYPYDPEFALDALELMMRWRDKETNEPALISCDLETMGLNPLEDDIISIGFGGLGETKNPSIIVPVTNLDQREDQKRRLFKLMSEFDGPLTFQNGKFDLQFLDVYFGEPLRPRNFKDTMMLHYALDERPIGRYSAHGLKDMARVYYDIDDYRFDFLAFYNKLASKEVSDEEIRDAYISLFEYQAKDTVLTAMLLADLEEEVREEHPSAFGLLDNLLYPGTLALTEIELYGAAIDLPYLKELRAKYVADLEVKLTGLQAIAWPDFNPSSPIQVQRLFFDEWGLDASRGKSTEREALDSLKKRTKNPDHVAGINAVIEYRLRVKVLATYIDGMLRRVDDDGRLRTDLRLAGTATGRLSSSDPNLQNIPTLMGPEIRHAFIASPGYSFIEADYSQLELRVAAWLSDDKQMIQAFKDGRDIHRTVAAGMFSKAEEDVSDHERYLAKYVDFGVIYGRGARSLVEGWEMDYLEEKLGGTRWTLPQAEHFLKEFLNGFPGLTRWMRKQEALGLRQKYVESPTGRRRRFPFINDALRSHIGRQAVNTPIQGFASDICLSSLIRLHSTLPEGANILFPVHDALYYEVRNDLLDEVIPMIRDGMERDLPCGIDSVVPIPVKVKVGPRWSEVEEVK